MNILVWGRFLLPGEYVCPALPSAVGIGAQEKKGANKAYRSCRILQATYSGQMIWANSHVVAQHERTRELFDSQHLVGTVFITGWEAPVHQYPVTTIPLEFAIEPDCAAFQDSQGFLLLLCLQYLQSSICYLSGSSHFLFFTPGKYSDLFLILFVCSVYENIQILEKSLDLAFTKQMHPWLFPYRRD